MLALRRSRRAGSAPSSVIAPVVSEVNLARAAAQGVDVAAIDTLLTEVAATAPHADLRQAVGHYLARLDPDGFLTCVVQVGLSDLLDHDIEGFNDLVDRLVLETGFLADISYRVAGHVAGTETGEGQVLVRVTAQVEGDEYQEDDDDES